MRTITFVRHGQSMANVGGVTVAHHAIALTDAGRAQALVLAQLLPMQPALVLASPYDRARHTAQPYCQRRGMVPRSEHLLHEMDAIDHGLIQGMTGAQRSVVADAYWQAAEVEARTGPAAETFAEFARRVSAFRTQILAELPHETVVFGHGMWMAMLCWQVLGFRAEDGLAMQAFKRFQLGLPMPNGAVYRLQEVAAGHWSVRADEVIMRRMVDIAQAHEPAQEAGAAG